MTLAAIESIRPSALSFVAYAEAFLAIARSLQADDRTAHAAALLASASREADLIAVARWLSSEHRDDLPTLAPSLPVRVYAELSGDQLDESGSLDQELFLASRSMAGSSLETVRMLLQARRAAGLDPLVRSEELDISQVARAVDEIVALAGSAAKASALANLWRAMSPNEIAALHMTFSRSSASGGLDDELLAEAIARAFNQPLQLVRHSLAIEGDAGRTALAARRGLLEAAFVRPLQLIAPMHAIAIERIVDEAGALRLERTYESAIDRYVVEERLPGARAQLHVWPGDTDDVVVALLLASGRDVAGALPVLTARLAALPPGTVIDGHLIARDADGVVLDARAFERAATRGGVERAEDPARYVAFDVLVDGGMSTLEQPFDDRRFALERIAAHAGMPVTRAHALHDHDELERAYAEALAHGGLGVIAKRRDATYEFGRRTSAWLKAPGEPETLLAVVRYASAGPEGRDGPPGELTFGVWLAGDGDARLVNIGRADCGIDAGELERLTQRLRPLRGKRFGPSYEIEPRIVCELEYDAIRVSPRTDAGYTIRIACIRCIRWDLDVDRAASVSDIERRHRLRSRSDSLEHAVYVPGT